MKSHALAALAGAALLTASLALLAPSAAAQQSQPHLENCLSWGFMRDASHEYGAANMCEQPVHVWFMPGGGEVEDASVDANTVFASHLTSQAFTGRWIAAVCTEGYQPDVQVSEANWDAILNSQYRCVRRGARGKD